MTTTIDSFKSRATLTLAGKAVDIFRLDALRQANVGDVATLPYSIRVLLENLLRHEDDKTVTREHIEAVAKWDPKAEPTLEIAYRPARVLHGKVAFGRDGSPARTVEHRDVAPTRPVERAV